MDKSAEEWEEDIKRYTQWRDEAMNRRAWADTRWWNSKRADAIKARDKAKEREAE